MKKTKRKLLSLFLLTSILISLFTSNLYANDLSKIENTNVIENGYTSDGVYYEVSIDTVDSANTKAYPVTSKNITVTVTYSPVPSIEYMPNNTYYYSDGNFSGTLYVVPSSAVYTKLTNGYSLSVRYKGTVYSYD